MFIGRKEEKAVLHQAIESNRSEMVAVIGRRRVGKTYLINQTLSDHIVFKQTGVRGASTEQQLEIFTKDLSSAWGKTVSSVNSWLDAFYLLREYLEDISSSDKRQVVFFDELSWLASAKSNFLDFLGHFWNDWAVNKNIVVVLCGSVSSWIINKVINDKGGLHNRVTKYIHLKPFTLRETEAFLQAKGASLTRFQIVSLYMAIGGIPLYLEDVDPKQSAVQNIDRMCFSPNGFLRDEFSRLYPALFDDAHYHIAVIKELAKKHMGMTRAEIIDRAELPNGGKATQLISELEQSDFIMAYPPFGKKKKGAVYRLIDEYSSFYLRFIDSKKRMGEGAWLRIAQSQPYRVWSGYSFEGVCMKHIDSIKIALGISGMISSPCSFFSKGNDEEKGLQIDMLLDRADRVIDLFEVKFYQSEVNLKEENATTMRERLFRFQRLTKTKSQLNWVFISPYGLNMNKHAIGLVNKSLTLDDLFN
ncbi:MAG: ATP-binding protein [Bacteroidota bacterium]